jgi:formylglycine-generating enzyme required for sulfatase activity
MKALSVSVIVMALFSCSAKLVPAQVPSPARVLRQPVDGGFANSIGMQLVPIPAGTFMMGGAESIDAILKAFPAYKVGAKTDYLFEDEYPRHRIRITRPFSFGRFAVTVGQFKTFVTASGYQTEPERDGNGGWGYDPQTHKCEDRNPKYNWRNPGFRQTDAHPVVNVTWNDARAFCRWLSRKEGKTYRLPTEAEWEYACRAGTSTRYAHGDDPGQISRQANVIDDAVRTQFAHVQDLKMPENSRFTVPVGCYPPNAWGLYDMHGNVWQWCSDWYGKNYYANSPGDDPTGPESGMHRIRRGGAWNSFPLYARTSFRNWNTPDSRCVNLGFRVLLEPGENKAKRTARS